MMKNRYFNLLFLAALILHVSCEDKKESVYELVFNVSEIDFGRIEANTEIDTIITITNSTVSTGTYTGFIEIHGVDETIIMDHVRDISIEKGESVSINITFKPTGYSEYQGNIYITDENKDPKNTYELSLKGEGVRPVRFSLSPKILEFDLVQTGSYKDLNLTIKTSSISGFDLEMSLSGLSGDFSLPDGLNDYIVAINESVVIPVRYTPSTVTSNGSIFLEHNSSLENNPLTISLSGTSDESGTINSLIESGWDLFETGNYLEALSSFQDGIAVANSNQLYDSLHAEILNGSGWSFAFLREYSNASIDFKKIKNFSTASDLTIIDAKAGLVIVDNILGKYTSVIDNASALLSAEPEYIFLHDINIDYADIRLARAQAYFNTGDFINCALDLDILDPDNAPHSTLPAELLQFMQTISGTL